MRTMEERLRELPEIAQATGLQADEALKRKILRAAREKKSEKSSLRRLVPVFCCAVAVLLAVGVLSFREAPVTGPQPTDMPLIASVAAGNEIPGQKLALDVPQGSITIRKSSNPSYRSIWARANGGNFPLIGVNGRYYRMLTNPTAISSSLLGGAIGTVDTYTSEPALAGKNSVCSNVVAAGETVYAVQGMNGAMAAAKVDGKMRVFQRVSYGDQALVGGEDLADTLRAGDVVALEISGVGTINDANKARELIAILTDNASFLRSGGSETNQSLLIQLGNGLVLQMAVNGERIIACGTWACPEFFDAFHESLQ